MSTGPRETFKFAMHFPLSFVKARTSMAFVILLSSAIHFCDTYINGQIFKSWCS